MNLILKWLFSAVALLILERVLTDFGVDGFYTALIVALLLGILNAVVKPILVLLTLPINLLTLGLFTFVINAGLIFFVGSFVQGFEVTFLSAFIASIILWLVSLVTHVLFGD